MNLLALREKNTDDVLKKRFIQKVLNEQGSDMLKAQNDAMRNRGFTTGGFYDNSINVQANTLQLDILKLHRFVDMSTRESSTGKHKKKSHPIYNRIVFGHLSNIVNDLSFGFSDTIIQELKQLENNF
ncbi:hypothetical protein [Faecalibacter sp. LW9]|uniref:hypothetical protein n=1 Tax=Faecalibacter sp. LW9 TaxID=3103144 RepID=UPI002AFFC366|nr:hypothetical protein [Faecalibacter sp. LW9]